MQSLLEANYVAEARSVMLYQHPRQGPTYQLTDAGLQRLKKETRLYQHAAVVARIRIRAQNELAQERP